MPQAPSTRWCPTQEQLMILEEMYKSGVRTPNAPQIQQISAHLSYYGKIEGKNVFYWFQNHKARDRQKLRRRLNRHQQLLQQHQMNVQLPQVHQMDASYSSLPPHHILHQISPHFLQQGCQQEGTEAMNLISKLETSEGEEDLERPVPTCPASCAPERVAVMEACPPVAACCGPPRTLELFPTRSTGLREEGSTSKSSSCFTSH